MRLLLMRYLRPLVLLTLSVFIGELGIMMALEGLGNVSHTIIDAIIDSTVVTTIVVPIVMYLFVTPLEVKNREANLQLGELQYAEQRDLRALQNRIAISALLETSLESLTLEKQLEVALEIILTVPWIALESKGSIFLVDESDQHLKMVIQKNLARHLLTECARVPFGHCLCGRAAQEREVVFRAHIDHHHDVRFDGMKPHGHYCAPILYGKKLLGVLNLYVADGHPGSGEEEAFIATLCNTLAGVIKQRRIERALHDERKFRNAILDTTAALVTVLDPEGRIMFFNRACQKKTGYTLDEVKDRYIWDFLLKEGEADGVKTTFFGLIDGEAPNEYENHWIARDGREIPLDWNNTVIKNDDGSIRNIIATGIDVTRRKAAEAKLQRLAHHDALTGLPNRAQFQELLDRELSNAIRRQSALAVLFMDLDKFKAVNDTYGHEIGDLLLQEASQRIRDCLRDGDTVARLGGDEFTALLPDASDREGIQHICQRIIHQLQTPFHLNGATCKIGTSIGIGLYPDHDNSPDGLLKKADIAMYEVKKQGRNAFRFFEDNI